MAKISINLATGSIQQDEVIRYRFGYHQQPRVNHTSRNQKADGVERY